MDKNETNRMRNVQRSGGGKMEFAPPKGGKLEFAPPKALPQGIPVDMKKGAKRGKDGTAKALTLTQSSTASMGSFDVKRLGTRSLCVHVCVVFLGNMHSPSACLGLLPSATQSLCYIKHISNALALT